ncbi:MAG TPA: hypothetical protein VLJ59_11285 [Mycobacteriales bacterium]|nr:hypothetical protein [Mycobacteriales bacterium]
MLQASSAGSPLFWVSVASTVIIAFASVYWSFGGRETEPEDDVGGVWRDRLTTAVQRRVRAGLGSPDSLPAITGSRIPLGLTTLPRYVRPAEPKRLASPSRRELPTDYDITRVFAEYGDSLLILGAPGAGKSTLLLELAEAFLKGATDAAHPGPVPVILNLESWAERREPLDRWLTRSLTQDYNIPQRSGRRLSAAGALVILLDGLDDVPYEHRGSCVAAVNRYRRAHPSTGLAVCCRTHEYLESATWLALGGAVEIQPLEPRQVRGFIARAGPDLVGLLSLFDYDPLLREVLDTPLLLNIVALTYRGQTAPDIHLAGAVEGRRELLLDEYIRQALEHWAPSPVPLAQRVRWLSRLAGGMLHCHQRVLHLLWMQPRLVEPARKARTVVVAAAAVAGLGGMVISGICCAALARLPYEVPIDMPRTILYPLSVTYITGSTAFAGYSRVFAPPIRVHWSSISLPRELWWGAVVAVAGGLPVGLIFSFVAGLRSGLAGAAIFGTILGLIVVIQRSLRTLTQQESEDGRRMTGAEIVRVASRYGVPFGVLVGTTYALVSTLYFGAAVGIGQGAIITVAFSTFGSYFLWLAVGGRAYVQHYVLRVFLARHQVVPYRFEKFLTEMTKATIMRRRSGGYVFMHDLVQAHLSAGTEGADVRPASRAADAGRPGPRAVS